MSGADNGQLELADVQGLITRGYAHLSHAQYQLLSVDDATTAKAWVREGLLSIPTGASRADEFAWHLALTWPGLLALGLNPDELSGFSLEFRQGMADPQRARMLGDVNDSDPSKWQWGNDSGEDVHLLLLCYASNATVLERECHRLESRYCNSGLRQIACLDSVPLTPEAKEHFGFRDGIGQPLVQGFSRVGEPRNTVKAGEFVLGYDNEYGKRPVSPGLRRANGSVAEFGRNGSYLVVRQLSQDVQGFWSFLDEKTHDAQGESNTAARLQLAAKMVGRWPSGCPVTLCPDKDDPTQAASDDFLYRDDDAQGHGCPLGSHVRRANLRDALEGSPEESIAISNRHRLLRRGRSYGEPLHEDVDNILAMSPDETPRGLHFICFNTDIRRQFEFVQQTWINNTKFAGLNNDSDPLLGQHQPSGAFTLQVEPARRRVSGMKRFVQTQGGACFFMPGIAALERQVDL